MATSPFFNVLQQKFPSEVNDYVAACWRIRDGIVLSPSIDDFIDTHRHDEDIAVCGKLAIARSILESEQRSTLFYDRRNINDTVNFTSIENTWYVGFFQLISQGVTRENIESLFENVTVICFNYDRCVEHFLVHAIAAYYQIRIEEAGQLAEKLTIFHPYGSVGTYLGQPHQNVAFGLNGIPNFDKVVRTLRTYTEQIEDKDGLDNLRAAIVEAQVIVFLGTAFHANNMAVLIGEPSKVSMKKIYATRKGISDADLAVVNKYLSALCGIEPPSSMHRPEDYFFADECHQLFDQYRLSLRQ